MNIVDVTVRKNSHDFRIFLTDRGKLLFSVDGGDIRHAKNLSDGHINFIGTVEIVVRGELLEMKSLELPADTYEILASSQEQIRRSIDEEQLLGRLKCEDKSSILKRVDRWKKRVCHYRKNGKNSNYAIHDFTIGAQTYRFFERRVESEMSWDGVLINPDYKVDRDLPGTGAVPAQRGELTFWLYYTKGERWKTIRELTLNELICVEIIRSYGLVREGKI